MRMLPYRTVENVIEGAVLTFVDIAGQKRAEQKLRDLSDDLERRVEARVAELATANLNLARETGQRVQAEARRVTDISAMRRLHDLIRIAHETEKPKLLQTTLDAAMELTGAKMGSLQLYDPASRSLALAAQSGFKSSVLEHFGIVTSHMISCCGDVLTQGKPVVVEDIAQSSLFQAAPALGVLQAAGVRSVQTTPIIGREGRLLAVFSTHSTKPYKPDEGTLRLLDLLARQLADLLEARADGESGRARPGNENPKSK